MANNPIPEVMAACFGAYDDGEQGKICIRDEMVLSDMARLRDACARKNRDLPADAQKKRRKLDETAWRGIRMITKSQINAVLGHTCSAEATRKRKYGPQRGNLLL